MLTVSIPKLLQEANEIKQALEQMGAGVPAGISAAEMGNRIAALENIISELDKVNANRTQLVNSKAEVFLNGPEIFLDGIRKSGKLAGNDWQVLVF